MSQRFAMNAWCPDENGWNQETGEPGILRFGNAIQVWSLTQGRTDVTVDEAAKAFNVEPRWIVEAVEDHPWMYLSGPLDDYTKLIIGHDGE